jgi:hypothetical protein
MTTLSFDAIQAYRTQTFNTHSDLKISTAEQAVDYVNARGIVAFWPIKGILLPSLWNAVAGDRPVPDEHDDPGHVTWGWKDEMLGKKKWYYARVIRRRNTFISLETAPYFYALTANYGSPEEDYLEQYRHGQLTLEAKLVYEALLKSGPLDTISLRKTAHLTSRESNSRFNRAIDDLMIDFKILPVGVCDAGAWHYAYVHDLVHRHFPEIPEQARFIQEREARCHLIEVYLNSVGAVTIKELLKVFGWDRDQTQLALNKLEEKEIIKDHLEFSDQPGEWIALSSLL